MVQRKALISTENKGITYISECVVTEVVLPMFHGHVSFTLHFMGGAMENKKGQCTTHGQQTAYDTRNQCAQFMEHGNSIYSRFIFKWCPFQYSTVFHFNVRQGRVLC